MSSPTISHYVAVEHILCYLKEAFGRRILYKKHKHTIIEYFFDADWAGSFFFLIGKKQNKCIYKKREHKVLTEYKKK